MPRPRKSLQQHALENTEVGYVVEPSQRGSLPRAPKCLSKDAKKKFRALARQLADRRTVTAGDAEILMLYADAYELWLEARSKLKAEGFRRTTIGADGREVEKLNDALITIEKCSRQMVGILTRLGLTPKDREAVRPTAPPVKKTSDELYAEQLANEPEPEPAPRTPMFAPGELDDLLSRPV
jgi:P27 family predicted phage terminase small subunit